MSPLNSEGQKLTTSLGSSLFDYADALKIRVPTSCGRTGECHECIVDVTKGIHALCDLKAPESFLRGNYRLACQATVIDESEEIEFSVLRRQPRILTQSINRPVDLDPFTKRSGDKVVSGDQKIDEYRGQILGLSIDIGTTTVVLNLVDLENGKVLHTASFENPQRFGGSDVMHRISYDNGEFQGELQQVILSAINFEIGEMSRNLQIHRRLIYEVVIVGNATMRDLFFGYDVQSIGERPYKSLTEVEVLKGSRSSTAINITARELGLRIFPGANVYGAPLIASHVGSDIVAGLLGIGMDQEESTVMLVDVGTNTEVVIGNRHKMMAASCPAGPAFEGGEVTYGMPGYDGAIERVSISEESVEVSTIGGSRPQGICGSGLVDLLAELRRVGKMNQLGVFNDGSNEFFFEPENQMSLSRSDISALAQAKSANFSGQFIVLRNFGVGIENVEKLYLAGGFANYVNVDNAIRIGFIANINQNRVVKVGNSSLEGATLMLLSKRMRDVAETIVNKIEHVELETTPDFFEIFVEGCMFNPMTPE